MENKTEQFVFRATKKEAEKINEKVKKYKLVKSEYLRQSALENNITVIDGLTELTKIHLRNGNNINQIAKKMNTGINPSTKELEEIKKGHDEIWQFLNQLIQKHQ